VGFAKLTEESGKSRVVDPGEDEPRVRNPEAHLLKCR